MPRTGRRRWSAASPRPSASARCCGRTGTGRAAARPRPAAPSWVEVFHLAGREVNDVLGDVRDPVADPLEVVRREEDPRPALDVGRVGAHQVHDVREYLVVEMVDLVVARGDL